MPDTNGENIDAGPIVMPDKIPGSKDEGMKEEKPKPEDSEKSSSSSPSSPEKSTDNGEGSTKIIEVDGEDGGQENTTPKLDDVKTAPYNHEEQQEIARRRIAYSLVGLVLILVLFSCIYLWVLPLTPNTRKYVDNLIVLLQVVFGPIITLAGTAIGYYFGANSGKK